jgi:hypothetical protein
MEEKRKESRIKVNWPIRVNIDNKKIKGKARNISLKGIFIECKEPLQLDGVIHITIMPPSSKPINVVGKIMWSTGYAKDMDNDKMMRCVGLSFVEISSEDRPILKDIIDIPIENY